MARDNPRRLRVAAELQRLANELLCNEIGDPRLSGVRISDVELSGDLGVARLFFNTLDPDQDPQPVERALQSASGFMRSRLGRALGLRRVPELRFARDVSVQRGMDLSRLIDAAVAAKPADDTDDGTTT
ncbi:MAG TPA: 30S ribosome-binding factor RbfA [Gammaproteobacteria bacterium]|nr:30S ribosome-binding factor RbfA [Gammaproteobacteria bacterium]